MAVEERLLVGRAVSRIGAVPPARRGKHLAGQSDDPRGARQDVPAIIDKVLRAGEGKILRKLHRIVEQVNSIEEDYEAADRR